MAARGPALTSATADKKIQIRRLYIGPLDVRVAGRVLFGGTTRSPLNDCDMNHHHVRPLCALIIGASLFSAHPAAAQAQASPTPPAPASTQPTRSLPLAVPPGSFLGGVPTGEVSPTVQKISV